MTLSGRMFFLESLLVSALVLIIGAHAAQAAEVVELPSEELAKESVTPVFDKNESVKNRIVKTEGAWDLGLVGGLAMTEPIFNVSKVGFNVYYHPSEYYSIGLLFFQNSSGLSSNAQSLSEEFGVDFARASKPEYQAFLDYNLKMFYGKMSVTKWVNFNTQLMATAGVGGIKYTHKMYPAFALGLANKFYFTPAWAFRFDLRLVMNNAPIPIKSNENGTESGSYGPDKVPEYSEFKERVHYSTNLEFGLSYLF